MKTYKKVELEAVNAPSGSYAAGCPTGVRNGNGVKTSDGQWYSRCSECEIAQ